MAENGAVQPAKATPSKSFFTQTLPRDISLSDCILDLVDNSIQSLLLKNNLDVSEHLFAGTKPPKIRATISIRFTPSEFSMTDNCGGISLEDAQDQVFRFGEPVTRKNQTGLGVYGIGMKRAFFKIGNEISVTSHTTKDEFGITIDVEAWQEEEAWAFPFDYARTKKSKTGETKIRISDLHPTVSEQFVSKAFKAILLEKMSRAYALFLKAGLSITVNGQRTISDIPELAESKDLQPIRQMLKKDGVDVLILAGLSPKSDRTPRGWYIFCNGRLVLDADKTERTGWGLDSHPVFHVKFNHFLGYVYFRSRDVRLLPWTTTKDGVDRESPVYQKALSEMRLLSRPVLDFLNEYYEDVREQSEPERAVFEKARPVSPQIVAHRKNAAFKATVKRTDQDAPVSIQYKRPHRKLERVRQSVGKTNMSASRIGEYTFDWFYERNCK